MVVQSLETKVEVEVLMDWMVASQMPRRQNIPWRSCFTSRITKLGWEWGTLGGCSIGKCGTNLVQEVEECLLGLNFERWYDGGNFEESFRQGITQLTDWRVFEVYHNQPESR